MPRTIRIVSTLAFVSVLGLTVRAAGATTAQPAAQPSLRAYQVAQTRFERHLAQMRLRARPHQALPRSGAAPTAPAAHVHDTKPIGADAVPRPEPPHAQTDTTIEPDIAVDPTDPNGIVATYQEGRFRNGAAADVGFATSRDGGHTWVHGNMPNLTQAVGGEWERASDPAVAWGPNHLVYINTLVVSFHAGVSGMAVQRSDDGGLTWNDPVVVQSDPTSEAFNDKNWIAVDTFTSSPHYGRVYVAWDRSTPDSEPIVLRYSDDHGKTWSDLISIPGSTGIGALPLVEPNGHLAMVWDDFGSGSDLEVSAVSTDGGHTWGPLVTIDSFQGSGPPDMRTGGLPAAAVDPRSGALYVVWQDARYRSDGTNDIVMSRSANEGRAWRPIAAVNGDGPNSGIDHFTPAVAAWGPNVHVTYRTRVFENGVYSQFVGMGYIRSTDNGATFGKELQLGPATDIEWAARGHGKFLGDYMAIAAWKAVAHPVWCVARAPIHRESRWHQVTWSTVVTG